MLLKRFFSCNHVTGNHRERGASANCIWWNDVTGWAQKKKNASSENNLPEFLAVQGKIEIFSIVFERRNLACQSDFLEGGGGGGGGGGGVGMGEWG